MARGGGNRRRRVDERLRQIIAGAIERELADPRLELVTVTEVRATSDVKAATVYYTVLDRARRAGVADALGAARGLVQARVAEQLGTRNTPHLEFVFDELQDRARALTSLIDGLPVAGRGDGPAGEVA